MGENARRGGRSLETEINREQAVDAEPFLRPFFFLLVVDENQEK